jgi:hypothetical protein
MSKVASLFQFPGLVHFIIGTIIVTAVEITGLVIWLDQQMSGNIGLAALLLFVFLLLEHIIAQIDHHKIENPLRELGELAGFTALEALIWVVWLLLIPINGLLALAVFVGGLYVEHQITDNVKRRPTHPALGYFDFRPGSLVILGLVIFTISEVVGAVIWVQLVPGLLIAMIVGSLIEHYIAGNVGRINRNETI